MVLARRVKVYSRTLVVPLNRSKSMVLDLQYIEGRVGAGSRFMDFPPT